MWIIIIPFLFFFGAVIGSFVNVIIERTIHGEDWIRGRSRCDHCKHQIAWYDNIPLLSYAVLGGKCRYCKKEISIQHPVIELLTGILFVWWYGVGFAFFQLTQRPLLYIQPAFWLIVGIFLLIIVVTDYLYMIIPDYTVVSLGLLAITYRVYLVQAHAMQPIDLWWAIISGLGSALLFYFLWYITKGRGMGFGDVKYVLVMGWLLGWPRTGVGIFCAFLIGAIIGIGLLLSKRKKLKQRIAFGPFLVLGTIIALVWGNQIWQWYMGLMR